MRTNTNPVSFGELVRQFRISRGFTCEELSQFVGVEPKDLAAIEAGQVVEIGVKTLILLAEAFRLSERAASVFWLVAILSKLEDDVPYRPKEGLDKILARVVVNVSSLSVPEKKVFLRWLCAPLKEIGAPAGTF